MSSGASPVSASCAETGATIAIGAATESKSGKIRAMAGILRAR